MTIVADSREPTVPFDTEELPAGDYVITGLDDSLIIERKEWTDLVQSFRTGHLFQQLRMCQEQEDYRCVLLVEGNKGDAIRHCNASQGELRRFISSIVAKFPAVELAFTTSFSETKRFVKDCDDWLNDDRDRAHSIRPTEKVPSEKRAQYIIEGLPNVGPTTAQALVDHFGTPLAVFQASKSELQEVDGIGPKTAETIYEAVR